MALHNTQTVAILMFDDESDFHLAMVNHYLMKYCMGAGPVTLFTLPKIVLVFTK